MTHPTPDELTVAALPGEPPDPAVSAHLATCTACAAEVDALRRTVDHARDGMNLDAPAPPPALWQGILDRLGDDAPTPEPAPAPSPAPELPGRPGRPGRPRRRRRVAVLVAAAALVVAVGAVAAALAGTGTTPPDRVALVALRAGVTGEVVARPGPAMHVEVTLPAALPDGEGLEVWDLSSGSPRSLGVLLPVEAAGGADARTRWTGDLALPPGDRPMPPLDVSVEPPDADPGHSGTSLARTP